MLSKPLQGELVQFRRVDALPGVEILDAINTSRDWRVFNLGYGLAVPRTWHGVERASS